MSEDTRADAKTGRGLFPILTQQRRAPWAWVVMIQAPWLTTIYLEQLSSTALTFTLRKFIELPLLITLIGSFNILFNVLVGASCNYASDRVWTRIGRRRPFLVFGFGIAVLLLVAIPLVGQLWVLVMLLCLYEMLRDVNSPQEPLANEVVPPEQRGRSNAVAQIVRNVGILFFFSVMIGQFDKTFELGGFTLTGEMLIYWTGALMGMATAAGYLLLVRELPPPAAASPPGDCAADDLAPPAAARSEAIDEPAPAPSLAVGRRLRRPSLGRLVAFLKDVFGERQNWLIYTIALSQMTFWIGLGQLTPLLYTEQWGFSKDDYGKIVSYGGWAAFAVIPLAGWMADKIDRARAFAACAILTTIQTAALYVYARHFAPGGQPEVWVLVTLAVAGLVINNVGVMTSVALMFDYVQTSRMGTVSAGIGISRGVAGLLVNNGVGLWVTLYSGWFPADTPTGADYLAGYHYLIFLGVLASAAAIYFAVQAKRGKLVRHGVLEQQARTA